ncbi:MAG: hypothetical protein ACOH1T_03400 [Microbacteriaceae bacterium]
MEILFVVLLSAALGLTVRYLVRGRDTYGAALLPAVSVAVSVIVWVALLWGFNWQFDGTWIWVAALLSGPIVAFVVALALPRKRRLADRSMLTQLSGGKA